MHPIAHNRGKKPIIYDDVDTPANDELSLGKSPSLSLSPVKNTWESTKAKSCKRPSHHLAFSDAVSGISHRARREACKRQNQPVQALGNVSVLPEGTVPPILLTGMMPPILPVGMMPPMPFVHPVFGTGPTFYMPSATLIQELDDLLSFPLGQHILD